MVEQHDYSRSDADITQCESDRPCAWVRASLEVCTSAEICACLLFFFCVFMEKPVVTIRTACSDNSPQNHTMTLQHRYNQDFLA